MMLLVLLHCVFGVAFSAPVTQTSPATESTRISPTPQSITEEPTTVSDTTTTINIIIKDTTEISISFMNYSTSQISISAIMNTTTGLLNNTLTSNASISTEETTAITSLLTREETTTRAWSSEMANSTTEETTTRAWSSEVTNSTLSTNTPHQSNGSLSLDTTRNVTEQILKSKIRAYFDAVLEEEINNIANDTGNERITFRFRDFLREVAKENTNLPPLMLHLKHKVVQNNEVTDVDEYISDSLKDFVESLDLKDLLDRNINARKEEVDDEMPNYINLLFGGFGK